MDYITCGEKELNTAAGLLTSLKFYLAETTAESDLYHNLEVTNEHDLNGLKHDLEGHPILEHWLKFKAGETKVTAYDTSGTGVEIIDILHNDYDKVFGRYEEDGEHVYFISETRTNWNEELKEDETIFFVGNTPVSMNDCIRHNI